MRKGLLIIDVQNDYFPNGRCELFKTEKTLENIKKLLEYFRKNKFPIYYIKHISENEDATFFLPGTDGIEIHKEIKPLNNEKVVIKNYPNSFYNTDLKEILQKDLIDELIVCGMMTHMCIDTTVRAARDLGYKNILVSDACTTKDLEWNSIKIPAETVQNVYMASLNGEFAHVIKTEEYFKKLCEE